jgi:tetratricopeptide (TPR) repeat protein
MLFHGNAFRQSRIVIGSVCVMAIGWIGCQTRAQEPQPANTLLAQARSAVQAGSFSSAEALARKYVSQQDASADGHYLLGYILSHEGKPKESLAEYTRAAQLRPPSANDFKVVAVDYVYQGAQNESIGCGRLVLSRPHEV